MEKQTQPEALRLAEFLRELPDSDGLCLEAAAELSRLHQENELLMNALWKACGDDGEVVEATIESQR